MPDHNTIDEAYDKFRQLLKIHFSDLFIRGTGYAGPEFHADLPRENLLFKNTPYFYNEELTFIHWTSISNFFSIINNREIRLYNLFNSEDKDEFDFAATTLGLSKDEIDFAKKYYYTFSFCKKEDLTNEYLWKEYGKDYSGVAIEFSIKNDPLKWETYMISPIHYKLPENFAAFNKDIQELKNRYNVSIKMNNFGNIIGFHKKENFHNEREIRIATYFPYNNMEEYLKFSKTEFRIDIKNKRNRITDYISLPLWVDNNSAYLKSDKPDLDRRSQFGDDYFLMRPQIEIKNIYFGRNCGIENADFSKFRYKLLDVTRFSLGYRIDLPLNLFGL